MSGEGLDVGVELAGIGVLVQREAILDRYAGDGDRSVLQLGSGKGEEDVDITVHTHCVPNCVHIIVKVYSLKLISISGTASASTSNPLLSAVLAASSTSHSLKFVASW